MNCPKCGNLLEPGAKACSVCGTVIGAGINESVVEIIPNSNAEVNQPKVEIVSNDNALDEPKMEPQVNIIKNEAENGNVEITPVNSEEQVINIPSEEVKVENVNVTSGTNDIPSIQNIPEPVVQQPVENINQSISNVEINNQAPEKKNSDTLFYVIVGILSFLIVGAVVYILFIANK